MTLKKLLVTASVCVITFSAQAYASTAGLCNNYKTQYICCPAKGGWIVSDACDSGAAQNCVNDSGLIATSNPPISILQDCKNRGGSAVMYPFTSKK